MMDDNSAILELITEFLVSKNLLHTAQTLQHEWVNLYPGHSFPDINNLMEGHFTSAIPVEPTGPPQYMHSYHQQQHQIQQHHHQLQQQQLHHQQHLQQQHLQQQQQQQQHNHHFNNMIRSGEMEDDHHHHHHPDEPMHEEEEEEEDDGLLDEDAEEEEGEEEEEEEGELEDDGEIGNGETEKEGEGDDTVSVDSAYSRILVEDISEIMDEITADEEDMGEIDPLANEVSPSDESESEMDEDDNNDAGEDEAEYEDEEGEGTEEGENADLDTIPQDEEEEEEEEGEERTEEEEEETTEQIHKPASRSPSPTRGVIESVTELLGQHIQTQRDEFYQEEGAESGEKDISVLEIATLHINDPVNQPIHSASPFSSSLEAKPLLSSSPLSPHDQDHYHGLRAYECDVTIVNYDNKKSGAMFSPLISPTPHSPTPVFSPGNVPAMRSPPPSTSSAAPSPLPHSSSVAPPLSPQTSRSALYRRDVASPLGKKHVHITNETGSPSRSNSNLSARHGSPPPPSPTSSRARLSTSASAPSALSLTVQDSPSPLSSSPSAPDTPSSTSLSSTPTTPPPPYCFNPTIPEILINAPTQSNNTNSATPNITTLNTVQSNGLISNKAEGTEGAGGRRASLDGRAGDVVMKDLSPRPEKAPFSYPVQVDDTIYDCFNLKIVHVKNRTGFESTKDFPIKPNTLVAGRYQILEFLDSAAFSKAVRALDLHTGGEVCMKIIKNNKDYVDQSLDEIKLLKYLNSTGDPHKYNILQLYDFFYYKEHLFIVTELLRENLYEFYKFTNENGHPPYFTMPRLQKVAQQCLHALEFIHSLDIIHTDLKPENILIKSYSRCEIKIIDFGSSCFTRDHLGSYVQSRDYRAVEVILGLPYSPKIDIWSLGCILAELFSGKVLFVNRSLATLLARVSALVGPIPADMIAKGRFSHKFFTKFNSLLYERDEKTGQYYFLQPKRISLKEWLKSDDDDFVDFIETLLSLRPDDRPTATAALQHKWLHKVYPPIN